MADTSTKVVAGSLAILALIALIAFGNSSGWFGTQATTQTSQGGAVVPGGSVIVEDNPDSITLTYNDQDMADPSNDPASVLRIYSPDKGNVSDDGTKTLAINTDYKAIAGFASSTYYGKIADFNSGKNNQLQPEIKLARVGDLTITAFNPDDGQPNSGTDTVVLDANDVDVEVEVCYDVVSNRYWGAPDAEGKSMVIVAYNTTGIKDVDLPGYAQASAPSNYSISSGGQVKNASTHEAFYIPNLVDGVKNCFDLSVDTTTTNPGTTGNHIYLTFIDANVDLDEQAFKAITSVQDNYNDLISLREQTEEIYVS